MPQHVNRHILLPQRRETLASGLNVLRKTMLESITAQHLAQPACEDRLICMAAALRQPSAHDGNYWLGQGRNPPLPPLPQATDMRSGSEMNVRATKTEQLGRPEASLGGK